MGSPRDACKCTDPDIRNTSTCECGSSECGPEGVHRLSERPKCVRLKRRSRHAGPLVVIVRNANHSAFNGRRRTRSDYSEVKCMRCGETWRSKGAFVDECPDATHEQALWQPSGPNSEHTEVQHG